MNSCLYSVLEDGAELQSLYASSKYKNSSEWCFNIFYLMYVFACPKNDACIDTNEKNTTEDYDVY